MYNMALWPEEAWGMKLGAKVNKIRSREDFVKHYPERCAVRGAWALRALGFRLGALSSLSNVERRTPAKKEYVY